MGAGFSSRRVPGNADERQGSHSQPTGTSLNLRTFLNLQTRYQLTGEFPSEYAYRYLRDEQIGRENLKKLDKVAYVRFASVYRSFEDISEFRDAIESLESEPRSD